MSGATWDERQPGDWLASNGRWYPASKRPRSWNTLALPPAPGHGGVSSLHRTTSSSTSTATLRTASAETSAAAGAGRWDTSEDWSDLAPPPGPETPPPPTRRTTTTPGGRRIADATATNVRTYKYRLPNGQGSPQGLPPVSEWRDDQVDDERVDDEPVDEGDEPQTAPQPPPPPGRLAPVSRGNARAKPSAVTEASAASYASDFGRVLGKARKRIEEAIEEAAEGR